jgi:hypothetical protein
VVSGVPPSLRFGEASWRPAVAALWRGKLASAVVSGITSAKLTIPAPNCELKNFHPTSLMAMERESKVFLTSRDLTHRWTHLPRSCLRCAKAFGVSLDNSHLIKNMGKQPCLRPKSQVRCSLFYKADLFDEQVLIFCMA